MVTVFISRALLILSLFTFQASYAWNDMGHKLIAQIAYDNLSPEARQHYDSLLYHGKNKHLKLAPFVFAATWLDYIKHKNNHRFDAIHYIDIPYSEDGAGSLPIPKRNALTAIHKAVVVLQSKNSTNMEKALSLRILIHVIGDIHQPLHTITLVNSHFPKGDFGGNLFHLAHNPIAANLHQYWDRGGGFLLGPKTAKHIREKARQLEDKWSCEAANTLTRPEEWIKTTHELAISAAYTISPNTVPNKEYKKSAELITQRQILFAGCRLACLLER